jgi:uncharacterized YigZ family protein
MLAEYRTLRQLGETEIVIRKSRFVGQARPVATEAEALQFLEETRKRYWNANHNCYAYVIGDRDDIRKQSDDGEPGGTAGMPILEVLKRQEVKYAAVIVTRYFGGIKLGAAGLIRAYSEAAAAGIAAAGVVHRALHHEVKATIDYTWLGKMENELRQREVRMGETEFADRVVLRCWPVASDTDSFIAWLTDTTSGQAKIERGEMFYLDHDD